jgi:hypothetical protein
MWMDNIKMDLVEISCSGLNWIGLAQNGESCNETSSSIRWWETTEWLHNLWPLE